MCVDSIGVRSNIFDERVKVFTKHISLIANFAHSHTCLPRLPDGPIAKPSAFLQLTQYVERRWVDDAESWVGGGLLGHAFICSRSASIRRISQAM